MQRKILALSMVLILSAYARVTAQYAKEDSLYKKCFVGSTLFMLGNFSNVNKPDFYQLNLGYRITGKDVISLEFKTWKYAWSLGIPYGPSYEAPEEEYPGYIREYGVAAVYQRFLWKGLYAGIHVMNAWQTFVDDDGKKIGTGFQIFNTYRVGYHIKLFKDRFYIEPSLAITHRPYQSKMPDSFEQINNQWPKLFYGEPGMHVGFNF